ncbi:MAG: hypothetical protein LBB36_00495 [Fibromonadaceae bacterium]|jgi:hypothetical protein|nr:hypothetical protein [Fibromonadaceae bacterium]
MSAISLLLPLSLSLAVQFLLWFNLLFPYNPLFENINRNFCLVFSLSGFFAACISLAFYRILVFEEVNKAALIIASVLQVLCLPSCIFFAISSLSGWLLT